MLAGWPMQVSVCVGCHMELGPMLCEALLQALEHMTVQEAAAQPPSSLHAVHDGWRTSRAGVESLHLALLRCPGDPAVRDASSDGARSGPNERFPVVALVLHPVKGACSAVQWSAAQPGHC